MLHRIEKFDEDVRKLVQRSLQLIALSAFEYNRLNIRQICEAISVPDDIGDSLEDDEVIDEYEVIKWCGSLIRKSTDGKTFEFAHFTVQEFLETCHSHATLQPYHISKDRTFSLPGSLSLRYLMLKNHSRYPEETKDEIRYISERNATRPFYEHAATWWPIYVSGQMEDGCVSQLLQIFFKKKTATFASWVLELVRHCLSAGNDSYYKELDGFGCEDVALTVIASIMRPDFTPLHVTSVLGLPSLYIYLLEQAGWKPT